MDLKTVHLLIKKRKSSAQYFIEGSQYSLKEVVSYIRLHPAKIVHIQTIEKEDELLEAYIPSSHPQLQKSIAMAAKAKIFKPF